MCVPSAWPPVRTSPLQERGCVSTTPCVVPRARPLRAPPFGRHLAHAVPHAGQRPRGTRKVGAQGSCTRNGTRGRAHTQWGRGAASLRRPCFSCRPRVVRGPIEAHGVGRKGEGRGQPRAGRLRGTPARKRREWCLRRPTHLAAPPILLRSRATLPVHARMGAPSPHPVRTGREGQKGGSGGPYARCPVQLGGTKGGGRTFFAPPYNPRLRTEMGWHEPRARKGEETGRVTDRRLDAYYTVMTLIVSSN